MLTRCLWCDTLTEAAHPFGLCGSCQAEYDARAATMPPNERRGIVRPLKGPAPPGTNAHKKAGRARYKAEGRCVNCGRRREGTSTNYCDACWGRKKARARANYAARHRE